MLVFKSWISKGNVIQSIDPLVRYHAKMRRVGGRFGMLLQSETKIESDLRLMGGGLLRLPREVRTHSLLKGIKRMFSWENVLPAFNF